MKKRVVVASTIGTALEWYDFGLYGLASALVFNKVFFSDGMGTIATLASFATFAVGFFFRPVGGVIIGHFGDRIGRRTMMFVTLGLMGTASTLIGLLPTYESIGMAAPILLVLLRILQGVGSGAEYAGAALMTTEYADRDNRGFWGSFPVAGNAAGVLLASASFTAVSSMPDDAFLSWGWRIPFLASFLVAGVGLYIRMKIAETPDFQQVRAARQVTRAPLAEALRGSRRTLFLAFVANFAPNIAGYVPAVFVLSYVADTVGAPESSALAAVTAATCVRMVTPALFGALSDRVGRKPVYVGGALFCAAISFPFFLLLDTGSALLIGVAVVAMLGIGDGALLGPQPAFYAELFRPQVRYSSIALTREFSAALIGGTAPFVASALVAAAGGDPWLVAAYITAVYAVSAWAAHLLPETRHAAEGAQFAYVRGRKEHP
ncbi:MFS transporter [Nonomuraea diastatica]|uniref:Putative proline/betaine transporter n=1 Tax=Nonomuraea diastatica TaxID=1848329 RepID=A0A4V6PD83_9ACTN|nr:MFS transporter [Nonomuraea diastatica]TDD25307.1 MFS transporter [Nonomuraea diastatica]